MRENHALTLEEGGRIFTGAPAFVFLWRECMAKTQPRLSPTT